MEDRDSGHHFTLLRRHTAKPWLITLRCVQVSDDTSYTTRSSRRLQNVSATSSQYLSVPNSVGTGATARRRKPVLTAKERNLRRLESNERERMRMHSLNDAFQVLTWSSSQQHYCLKGD